MINFEPILDRIKTQAKKFIIQNKDDIVLKPFIEKFLEARGSALAPQSFWEQWRARQRLEQYQDTIMMLGHSGYLETARRALVYTLRLNEVPATAAEVEDLGDIKKLHPGGLIDSGILFLWTIAVFRCCEARSVREYLMVGEVPPM